MEDCYYNLFLLGERDKLRLQTNFVTVYHGGKIALHSPVVGNVFGLRVCLFFLLCPHEVGLECSRNGLFKIDSLRIISTVMEYCRDFSFHCLHKAEPAGQELIDVALLAPEKKKMEDHFHLLPIKNLHRMYIF